MAKMTQSEWVQRWHRTAYDNAVFHMQRMCRDNPFIKDFERTAEGTEAIRALHEVMNTAASMIFLIANGPEMMNAVVDIPDIRDEEFATPEEPTDETDEAETSPEPAAATHLV